MYLFMYVSVCVHTQAHVLFHLNKYGALV